MIRAENVSLLYTDHGVEVAACRGVDFEVHAGEFVGLLGPSGSGKSSLLYLLSGLKNPTSGRILVEGVELQSRSDEWRAELRLTRFGFVFQQPYLLNYLNAFENVAAVAPPGSRAHLERASELLEDLGLSAKAHRFPHELSGGEKQRVCVARALVISPSVIFADEPTAALDRTNGENVVELLRTYRGDGALVMVTHDPTMVERADRVVRISSGSIERGLGDETPLARIQ